MPCYSPLRAFQCQDGSVVFRDRAGARPLSLPCGQCIGCRLERSRQWAIRCMHEASLYERNCFLTLTYRDECLPPDSSLRYKDFQDFMKRLRFSFKGHRQSADGTFPIRFYMCGEYGENFQRPHFHACIFNFDFEDKYLWMTTSGAKSRLFRSPSLERLWDFGFSSIGDVNFKSAAYVARYIMKKVNGPRADRHYANEHGVIRTPEFTKMSLKPGIGSRWFDLFKDDVFKFDSDGNCVQDFVVVNGKKVKPPRFYDKRLFALSKLERTEFEFLESMPDFPIGLRSVEFSPLLDSVKEFRMDVDLNFLDNSSPDRLRVREQVALAQLKMLKRSIN